MSAVNFIKMHGLGNDFIILDGRGAPLSLDLDMRLHLADRRLGVGCDQLIAIEPSDEADAFMRIWNADGGEVAACGNATRCIADLLMAESGKDQVRIQTDAGLLICTPAGDGQVSVDMGVPKFGWKDIPLAHGLDTHALPLSWNDHVRDPVAVNVGNPHAIFFVEDAEALPLDKIGPQFETDSLFPERANISLASFLAPDHIRLRVWERGVGITRACGTGACATAVAAAHTGRGPRKLILTLDGGDLALEWRETDDHIIMTGPVATSFTGTIDLGG